MLVVPAMPPIRPYVAGDHLNFGRLPGKFLPRARWSGVVLGAQAPFSDLPRFQTQRPDVARLSDPYESSNLAETIAALCRRVSKAGVVALAWSGSEANGQAALAAGGGGYMTSDEAPARLLSTLLGAVRRPQPATAIMSLA